MQPYNIFFTQNGNNVQKKIYMERLYTFPTIKETIHELDKVQNLVAFVEKTAAEEIIGPSCKYKWIPGWEKKYLFAFYIQKNSPFTPLFNYQ